MPIITVKNWPCTTNKLAHMETRFLGFMIARHNDVAYMRALSTTLRNAAVSANVPGIDSVGKVTVSFDQGRLTEEDDTIVIEVTGLFKRTDRTKKIRDHLAECLKAAINGKVEVFISNFDPRIDSFATE